MTMRPLTYYRSFVAVSFVDDSISGYCMSDSPSESEVRVISIGTAAMFRGQGVGSLLLKTCLSYAEQRGASIVGLQVAVDNVAALALYRRMGFVAVGRHTAYYKEPSGDVDAWEMQHTLG